MVKSIFNVAKILFCGLILCTTMSACSDDDDSSGGATGGESQSAASSVITTEDGDKLLLTKISKGYYDYYNFAYDDQGRIVNFNNTNFSYNPFVITVSSSESINENEEITFSGKLNSKGYLSTYVVSERYRGSEYGGSDYEGNYKSTIYLDYDDDDHLVKARATYSGTYKEYGETYHASGSGTIVFTWNSGKLDKVTIKNEESGYYYEETIDFAYGNQKNKYMQYPFAVTETLDNDLLLFGLCGLVGKGSTYLPVSVNIKYIEIDGEEEYEEEYEHSFSYTLNDNGTIASEKYSYGTYYYTYSELGDASRAVIDNVDNTVVKKENKKGKRSRLFGRHKRR